MKQVTLFSDGSCLGNPGNGGWGTILRFEANNKITEKELSGAKKHTTNNQMELLAVIKGLEALKTPCEVEIYSDSSYVVKAINEWLEGWVKKGWKNSAKKDVKNQDFWKQYLEAAKKHTVHANWVKGHSGHPENERCDVLARDQAESL